MDAKLLKKYPAMDEIQFRYRKLRSTNHSREESLKSLFEWDDYYCQSYEERLLHRIALGDAMAQKGELTEDMAIVTEEAYADFLRIRPRMQSSFEPELARILSEDSFGGAARYPGWEPFKPEWKEGDLFAYQLKGYFPELFHMKDKWLLFLVQGDQKNDDGFWEELVYISVCDPGAFPRSNEELQKLGFLPGFTIFREYQYLFALRFRREEELKALKLTYLGNFAGNYTLFRERKPRTKNPQVLVPDRGVKNQIPLVRGCCVFYQHFGLIATAEQADLAKRDWNYGAKSRAEKGEALPGVSAENTPTAKLCSRTYFVHHSSLASKIKTKTLDIDD